MNITGSPDISTLEVEVIWDISGSLPQVILNNQSTGSGLANCVWAYSIYSPSQTPIHVGDIDNPDITGNWTTETNNDSWPRPMNNIEYSGAPYTFQITVKDSDGNIYTAPVQSCLICRPVGNSQKSQNTYGLASSDVKVQCQEASIFFQDTTYHTYQGQSGTQYSSVLRVIYPIDETLVIPSPFIAAMYVTALVPISYSSKNYQFVQTVIYDYDLADNCVVRVRYQTIETFGVYCNIDLLPLVCEINKLLDAVETGNCVDAPEAQRKLGLIVGKFTLVMIGIQQPLTGVDVPALIDEIIAIGGFVDCNCCTAPTGIIPTTSSVIGGYNFLFNKLGGDVQGSWTTNGQNITLNMSDVTYVVAIGVQSPSTITAFSVRGVTSGDGYLKTYYIDIDGVQLAEDILTIIQGNTALLNLFNSLVTQAAGDFNLIVDMGCIGAISDACDYTFTLSNIPASPANAVLFQIQSSIDANTRLINYSFNLSTLSQLQSYLNTLGIGTFVVTNLGGGNVEITTSTNNYNLTGLVYSVSGGNKKFALFASDCSGFVPVSANQVVQMIIDYLCGITDNQMITSQDYTVCSIVNNLKVQTTYDAGTKENVLIAAVIDAMCTAVDYVLAQSGVNCASVRRLFGSNPTLIMQNTDVFLGTKVGECSGIGPVEAFTRMLQMGINNADCFDAFCTFAQACSGGLACSPYTIYQLSAVDTSPTSNNMDIVVTFEHPDAINNTIRYARIDNTTTPVYTTIPNVLPGDSPYTISGVPDGDYFVGITPIYADGRICGETSLTTGACEGMTAFSAIINGSGYIVISYDAPPEAPYVQVVINYPNGGTATTTYTNDGMDITITPPADLTGDYLITMAAICNLATGFKSISTAPVILNVTPADNSSLVNNSSVSLTGLSLTAVTGSGSTLIFSGQSASASGGTFAFYLEDGFYTQLVLNSFSGTSGFSAYLTTDSGTYTASGGIFTDVTMINGGVLTLTDPSPAP